ncbi:MAG: hypothetical protein K6F39_02860 [Lachnospiraceae bacterium]|nr:hypothetical protein [Lachnospiraceae bacterium]
MKNLITNFLIVLLVAFILAAGVGASAVYLKNWQQDPFESDEKSSKNRYAAAEQVGFPDISDNSVSADEGEAESVSGAEISEENMEGVADNASSSYEAPAVEALAIPKSVSAKSGLDDVEENVDTVTDDVADKLEDTLETGPTGDELAFNSTMYPYYHMLNDTAQHVYRQIYANATELNDKFKSVENDITANELKNAFTAVVCDHPELFYLDTAFSAKYRENGNCIELDLEYNDTAENISSSKQAFESAVSDALSGARAQSDEYGKEKAVHYAIAKRNKYNRNAAMNQSAYSALVNGSTVCAGYSRAFQYCLQQLGIPCYYCYGTAGENHAWNIVKLGDEYYNVDVTWDDIDGEDEVQYNYFNKKDSDYGTTHIRKELAKLLPPCNGETYRNLEPENEQEEETLSVSDILAMLGNDDESSSTESEPTETEGTVNNGGTVVMDLPESQEQTESGPSEDDEPVSDNKAAAASAKYPSLADYGLTEDDVITDIDSYYEDLQEMLERGGTGKYHVYSVIEGEDMYQQWANAYDKGLVKEKVLTQVVDSLGATGANVSVKALNAGDGKYILDHSVVIK